MIEWWWEQSPWQTASRKRDACVLWWQTYVWLARHGHLQMTVLRPGVSRALRADLQADERRLLREALDATDWVVADAARLLGITTRVCRYRIDKEHLVTEFRQRNVYVSGRRRAKERINDDCTTQQLNTELTTQGTPWG